ncbi:MAG: polysaccharide biosynthesis tyrosine autokinase [Candidatus Omnitrophica bacterium]|nr:polysaccharide biosynthesis tyrosine autokinase [Candidatus Omnitrophota bacterium]
MAQPVAYGLNFRDYYRILRKRKFLILLTFVLVLTSTVYYGRKQTPIYEAASQIKLEQRQTVAGALLESSIPWSAGDPMESTARIIESAPIAEKTAEYMGLLKEGMTAEEREVAIGEVQGVVSTERVGNTNLIRIVATHADPQFAMKVANGTAEVFVQWDLREKNKQARKVREFIENQLTTVEKQLHVSEDALKSFKETESGAEVIAPLSNQLIALKTQLAELLVKATEKHPEVIRFKRRIAEIEAELKTVPGGETEYTRLVREVKLNEQLYTLFKQKFEEARIAEAEKVSDVSIVDYATLPTAPLGGGRRVGVILGAVIGLMLGFIVAFIVENIDTSISTIEGVESLLSIPVLAVIPHSRAMEAGGGSGKGSKRKLWLGRRFQGGLRRMRTLFPFFEEEEIDHRSRLIVHDQPKSPIAESYRSLRTNLKFIEGITGKTLIVTSAGPREGKTTILINLGLTTAQMGAKTLLIDSDLRRPTIHKTFKINREPGLAEVLSGGFAWQEAVQGLSDILLGGMTLEEASKTPGLDHLFLMTSGKIPLNPSELLGSREMTHLMEELRKNFDVILYDAPPILPVTDAVLLAPKVDGVVIVYEIGRTARSALMRAKQQVESGGGKAVGIVLNHIKAEEEADASYAYYHYKYYGRKRSEDETEQAAHVRK